MRIVILGTRGFPNVQGGVEAHCEQLYPRLVKKGCEITVFTRKPYVDQQIKSYQNINLIHLDCPKSKSLEAIVHTLKGIFAARKINPDILHVHAIGPSLLVPLGRFLGMKVVMTNHGPDYQREKWGAFAKFVLRLGERLGSNFSNEVICISPSIADDIKKEYKRVSYVIPNGVEIPEILDSQESLRKFSLVKGKYILTVGRFVPEKGFNDLIDAFNKAGLADWKLVIVGKADHKSKYSRDLEEKAKKNSSIVLTGFLSGIPLKELYSHAGPFVLPSYYEGLPIVLLEAMSFGLLCLASDIPANRSINLAEGNYFKVGNVAELSEKLKEFIKRTFSEQEKKQQIQELRRNYNWDEISNKTLEVYKKVVKR